MSKQNPGDNSRYMRYLQAEQEAVALYTAMAQAEQDPRQALVFRQLAESEKQHIAHWAAALGLSVDGLPTYRPRLGVRLLGWIARRMGTHSLISILLRQEGGHPDVYRDEPDAAAIVVDEENHSQMLHDLKEGRYLGAELREKGWRRTAARGMVRAATMGGQDGVVSILALAWGVAGGTSDTSFILLATTAGLVAGAISMGAGEYMSVRVDRDIAEHRLARERRELEQHPDKEREELSQIYELKGLSRAEAGALADRIMQRLDVALDTMTREKLGLDPGKLVSPWGAAVFSFIAFSVGGSVPILPYLFASSETAFFLSGGLSVLVLFGAGAFLAAVSDKAPLWGGARMLAIGAAAAVVTNGVGRLVGLAIA